jgi:predicted Zn-dependent protease
LGYNVNPTLTLVSGAAPNGIANAMGMGTAGGQQVSVYMSLVEMTGDSDGELAFVMGHEIGHVIQCVTKGCKIPVDPQMGTDYESDADEMAMMLSTSAGYDSYAGAAMYAKLQVGNGQVSMGMMGSATTVWEDLTSSNPQAFFAGRINMMYRIQQRMCTNPSFSTSCPAFKTLMHPSMGGINMPM